MICASAQPILGTALAAAWRSVGKGTIARISQAAPLALASDLIRRGAAKPLVFNRPRRADDPRILKHPGGEPLDRVLEAGPRATAQSGVLPRIGR